PAHRLVLSADRVSTDPARQIRQRMDYRDGHDRAWRTVQLVEPGDGYRLSENGDFVYDESGEAVSGPLTVRWQVAAGDECSAGGLALLQYPGYCVDRSRPAREAPPLPFAQQYRDATLKPVLTQRGDGNYRLLRPCPWYVVGQDENDSYQGESEPEPDPEPEPDSDGLQAPAGNGDTRPEIGMRSERIDWIGPRSQQYMLGNGVRSYDPAQQRFLTMDSLSPFGAGGISPYAYCLGDPVNRADPSGHVSWDQWWDISLQVLAIALTVVTMIVAAPLGGFILGLTLMGGGIFIGARLAQITATVLEESHPEAAYVFKLITLALDVNAVILMAPVSFMGFKNGMRHIGKKLKAIPARKAAGAVGSPTLSTHQKYFMQSYANRYAQGGRTSLGSFPYSAYSAQSVQNDWMASLKDKFALSF
ncbi:RHS repeat-associated core domain-containing protein, partial [Microvirgula curvata]